MLEEREARYASSEAQKKNLWERFVVVEPDKSCILKGFFRSGVPPFPRLYLPSLKLRADISIVRTIIQN